MAATVYVGHICNRIADESVKELLDLCGQATKWSRQPDPMTGKWAHFGFCEFRRLEGAWRAVELLDGRQLGSRKLVVKADAKVQERIKDFPMTQRINAESEQRIMSTINAFMTAVNSKWRQAAMLTDAERQETKPEKLTKINLDQPVIEAEVLPRWYRDSRAESERVRRIERRRRDRQHDFEKAVGDWEKHEMPKMQRDLEREIEDPENIRQKKRKLIEQDGGEERVVSNFSLADRRREMEADDRDRVQEAKEIAAKREKDDAEYRELSERMSALCSKSQGSSVLKPGRERLIEPEGVPPTLRATIIGIPLSDQKLNEVILKWDVLLNQATLLKLRSWLRRKLAKIGVSEDDAILLSGFVAKAIEVERLHMSGITEKLASYPRFGPELTSEIARKCVQLLNFEQIVLSHSV